MKKRNMELGTIPISTPHLSKMAKMVNNYYIGLNDNEIWRCRKKSMLLLIITAMRMSAISHVCYRKEWMVMLQDI